MNDDDLDGDLNLSDSEDGEQKRAVFKQQRRQKKKKAAKVHVVEADTNIFQVSLSCLKNAGAMATGDPVICGKCQGVFNSFSQTKPIMGKESVLWTCEFCNNTNEIFVDKEEIPKVSEVNYLLEAAAQVQDKKMGGNQDISVVFCIDISGSMCVS